MNTRASVEVIIKGKSYTLGFPNVGETIEIESLKTFLTKGRYSLMALSPMTTMIDALNLVDSISYLAPLIGNDLLIAYNKQHVNGLMELEVDEIEELVSEYLLKYEPFYESIVKRKDRATATSEKKAKKNAKEK